jgi:membrane protease YdiL (CAAX protease family)
MNYCPTCGTKVTGTFCTSCGRRLPAESAAVLDVAGSSNTDSSESTMVLSEYFVPPPIELPSGDRRRQLVFETWFVMILFLTPGVISAVLSFFQSYSGTSLQRFPSIVSNDLANLLLGMLAYLPVLAVVPIALFLLWRTGQGRHELGLGFPSFTRDVLPGLGIGAAAFGVEVLMLIPFSALITEHSKLVNTVSVGHFPKYYVVEAIFMSAVTAVTEEVLVNGYLLTRLYQLGWSPRSSLILSLILRTSYHVYYGFGFILTIPFGYFVTRSFQKHSKLNRPIVAHFLYDAILFSIAILK